MAFSLKKDFCFWIVPPNSGKVKKFRLTIQTILCVGLLLFSMGIVFLFVTGDYTRVQLSRFKHYMTLKSVLAERDVLLEKSNQLLSRVGSLQNINSEAKNREKAVQERLAVLADILKSAPYKGVSKRDSKRAIASAGKPKAGVGGAEVDCDGDKSARCSSLISRGRNGLDFLRRTRSERRRDLVPNLDGFINFLRIMPFGPPVEADLNSGFGYRFSPFEGRIRMHEGVDFAMNTGSPIHVTGGGRVTDVARDSTYGLRIDVEHTPHVVTRYAHLSQANVHKGELVERGQIIGLVGSSGQSTGPHLHYEVLVDGIPKDPETFIEMATRLAKAFIS